MAGLKGKVVRGFAWNVAEKIASALFQTWVFVNVINRIVPEEYDLKGILAAFVAIFNIFVDSGLSQALIRNKGATETDYSSAFWFNMAMAVAVYAALVGMAYPTAWLMGMPDLVKFAPVFFLIIPAGALGIIQQTVLSREFDFKRLSTIFFASNVGSGIVAVAMAVGGMGFWAIVGQRLAQTAIRSALLWIFGRWKPRAKFSAAAIRSMFGFSSRLLCTDLLNNLYSYIPNFVIGRVYPRGTLGVFEQARSLRDRALVDTMNAMQSVTFPALAALRDDDGKFARAVGRVVGVIAFLMFPMMAGLVAVADELFGVFLAPQWHPSIPFFRILCVAGFATPLAVISSNILRSRSDGRDVLKAEIIKKAVATAILAATIPFGVVAIAWGVVAIAWGDAAVSFTMARRQSAYGFKALARDVVPTLALTGVMAAAVFFTGLAMGPAVDGMAAKTGLAVVLAVKMAVGAGIYIGGAAVLRLNAFGEFLDVVRKKRLTING